MIQNDFELCTQIVLSLYTTTIGSKSRDSYIIAFHFIISIYFQ